ncbi:uncharacterized protein LOC135949315 [Calliphora vicina]|uniref:uncharacterized protein LOC135949315 n=1 Tax=Calliphora vicina TaxID=7373 RepID=UPI00325BCFAC
MQPLPVRKDAMDKKESCPMYPVGGFIISGDPTPTAMVTGCGESNATVTQASQVITPGQTSLHATGVAGGQSGIPRLAECKKQKAIGGSVTSGEVPLDFSPSTSKAAKALTVKTVKTLASGASGGEATKSLLSGVSHMPTVRSGSVMESSCPEAAPPPANSGSESSLRHKNPARRAATTRRSAIRFIEALGSKKAEELTKEQQASLSWAIAHIAGLKSVPPSAESSAVPKRQRSEEDVTIKSQQPGPKRPKAAQRSLAKSFSEIVKDNLVRAVIDRSVNDGSISQSNWDMVKQKLVGVFWKVLKENSGTPPQCDDAGWYQGHVKLMSCVDERSALLLKTAVASLGEVWPGSRLEVVSVSEIPRKPRSIAKIPAEPSSPEEILEILQCCNPQLPTNDWKVVKVTDAEGSSRKAIVVLNKDSLGPLRKTQGKVYYGFGTIILRVYRSDNKDDTSSEDVKPMPSEEDMECNDAAGPIDIEDTNSVSELVGTFFERMDEAVDEDALLNSDQEDADVTVVQIEHGEGDANKPSPL